MKTRNVIVIGVCLLSTLLFFSGCINVPKELTQMSIVSFDVEPGIINEGEFANISWVVISASSVSIDNGIGNVALTGHRIIQPTQNTTYILTASNATITKSASITIIVKNKENTSDGVPTKTPNMAWIKETIPSPKLVVVSADNGFTWDTFTVSYTGFTGVSLNGGSNIVSGNVISTSSNIIKLVTAGDYLTFIGTTGTITIAYTPTNTLMGSWTWMGSSSNRIAIIDTTMGTIRVQLYEDKMPITTANFIRLANDGFYNGLIFHRIGDNFMIQSGGYYPNGTQKTSPYGNIAFETSDVKHVDGAISMASTGAKVGGITQFFICDGAQTFLDGNYAAFGVTIERLDVVRSIAAQPHFDSGDGTGEPITDIIINSITIVNL